MQVALLLDPAGTRFDVLADYDMTLEQLSVELPPFVQSLLKRVSGTSKDGLRYQLLPRDSFEGSDCAPSWPCCAPINLRQICQLAPGPPAQLFLRILLHGQPVDPCDCFMPAQLDQVSQHESACACFSNCRASHDQTRGLVVSPSP